jgi:TPR repeat protein
MDIWIIGTAVGVICASALWALWKRSNHPARVLARQAANMNWVQVGTIRKNGYRNVRLMRGNEEAIIWHKARNVLLVRLHCPITFNNFIELERWLANEEKSEEPEDAKEVSEEILYYREIEKYITRHGYFEPLLETQATDERFGLASLAVQKAGYLAGKPVNVVAALILRALECYGKNRKLSLEYLAEFEKKSQSAEFQRLGAELASLEEAIKAYQHGDYATARRLFRLLAEQGSAKAQYLLGLMYVEGQGVPQDDGEAVKWLRLAADQGHANAQYNLGIMYEKGRGVPQEGGEAVKWLRLAANQGHANAQYNLGFMYERGRGVPQDDGEAVKWLRLAADQGHAKAQYNLGIMYEKGRGVKQDDGEAVKWSRKAANQGFPLAQTALGLFFAKGQGSRTPLRL